MDGEVLKDEFNNIDACVPTTQYDTFRALHTTRSLGQGITHNYVERGGGDVFLIRDLSVLYVLLVDIIYIHKSHNESKKSLFNSIHTFYNLECQFQ